MKPEEDVLNQLVSTMISKRLQPIDESVRNAQQHLNQTRSDATSLMEHLKKELQTTERDAQTLTKSLEERRKKMEDDVQALILEQQKQIRNRYDDFLKNAEKEMEERRDKAFAAMEEKVTKDIRSKVFPLAP